MPALHELARPTTLDGVVGQPKAVALAARLVSAGLGGRAVHITGRSGNGKTTLARIMARSHAPDHGIVEIDAQDATLDRLRAESNRLLLSILPDGEGRTGRCIIINEVHKLRSAAVSLMLTLLDPVPARGLWIFTTTIEGASLFEENFDAAPFLSRCLPIRLESRGFADPAAARALEWADRIGLGGKDIAAAKRLVNDSGGNLRKVYCEIEAGALLA